MQSGEFRPDKQTQKSLQKGRRKLSDSDKE